MIVETLLMVKFSGKGGSIVLDVLEFGPPLLAS